VSGSDAAKPRNTGILRVIESLEATARAY
jgi:hypothetical protein